MGCWGPEVQILSPRPTRKKSRDKSRGSFFVVRSVCSEMAIIGGEGREGYEHGETGRVRVNSQSADASVDLPLRLTGWLSADEPPKKPGSGRRLIGCGLKPSPLSSPLGPEKEKGEAADFGWLRISRGGTAEIPCRDMAP